MGVSSETGRPGARQTGVPGPSSAERAAPTVVLESAFPAELPVGTATAIFCLGVCFDNAASVELTLHLDGTTHRPQALRMPRPDVVARSGQIHAYRSGWWTTLKLEAQKRPGTLELRAAVRTSDGRQASLDLAQIEIRPPADRPSGGPFTGDTVAICLATYNPDLGLLRSQLDSLLAQTDGRWICVISDDCSDPELFEQVVQMLDGDPRFTISRSDRRRGFYRNFERALSLVPPGPELVALCDQDDRWHPEKLETLRAALGDAQMVYSDQRLVDPDGRVLRETMWGNQRRGGRRNNFTDLASLLIANSVTGASILMRREAVQAALPFPDSPGFQFHDHWLALVALARGRVAYVDRPLYDYVQHKGAVFADVSGLGADKSPERSRKWRSRNWRAAYFCGYLAREVQAQTLLARCNADLSPRKRRALERYVAAHRSPTAFLWLIIRPLRSLIGRNETLGSEAELAGGILWRWLIVPYTRWCQISGRLNASATFPPPIEFQQRRMRRWRAGLLSCVDR